MTLHLAPPLRCATQRRLHVVRSAVLQAAMLVVTLVAVVGIVPFVGHAQTESLRPLADDADVFLGAAVDAEVLEDDGHRTLLRDNVNLLSTRGDLSMSVVQPEPGVFDFGRAEAVVDFAVDNDLPVRGHELIGGAVPGWISAGSWTADTLGQVLRDHVAAVVGHFRERNPGVIVQWDVVGDAFLADGTPRPTIWQQVIGDDHLRIAFEAARSADPDAQLFYDDFYDDLAVTQDAVASGVAIVPGANAERTTCDAVAKCVGIRDRIAALVAAGSPIDGIGFQSHLFSPDPADFGQLSGWVGELGLDWAVTEFDVPLPITETGNAESLQFQAEVYAGALSACADAVNCDTFVTWGITDRLSPIPVETGGAFGGALWFDETDEPKPAFDAMAGVLRARGTTPAPTSTAGPTPSTDAPATATVAPDIVAASDDSGVIVPVAVGAAAFAAIAGVIVLSRRRR